MEHVHILVTDYLTPDGKMPVSDAIQKLIDENPNRTIYFPDGIYLLDKPIATPADPRKSVDIQLSNYAVLKAADGWDSNRAMIRLGGKDAANDIRTPGSNYSFCGGIVDGSGVATAISIESGRETAIRNVSIKNVHVGIDIWFGANSGSSDADVTNVNIVGNGKPGSVGVIVSGFDNTFTNMRIARVGVGVKLLASGNMMRNIHPLYQNSGEINYAVSYAFYDTAGNNWYDYCYGDQFGCAFYTGNGVSNIYNNCFAFWYANHGPETGFRADKQFNSLVNNVRLGFHPESTSNTVLSVGECGGKGKIEYLLTDPNRLTDDTYRAYLVGSLIG